MFLVKDLGTVALVFYPCIHQTMHRFREHSNLIENAPLLLFTFAAGFHYLLLNVLLLLMIIDLSGF